MTEFRNLDSSPDDDEVPAQDKKPQQDAKPNGLDDLEVVIDNGNAGAVASDTDAGLEPEAGADPQVSQEQDEDLTQYSKAVRERIERERRVTARERERREQAEEELRQAKSELNAVKTQEEVGKLDQEIAKVRADLTQAKADLDSDKEVEAIDRLTALQAKKAAAEARKAAEPQGGGQKDDDNPARAAWFRRNPWFLDQKSYGPQRQAAMAINAEVHAAGFDDRSPKYYEELDRRLAKAVKVPRTNGGKPQQRDPVSAQTREPTPTNPNRIVLNQADLANMRKFGLDPSNPQHLKRYAAEVRASRASS